MSYLNYNNLFRILKDQTIPDRLEQITYYYNDNFTEVMIDLTLKDTDSLFKKACQEYSENLDYSKLINSQKELSDLLADYLESIDKIYTLC